MCCWTGVTAKTMGKTCASVVSLPESHLTGKVVGRQRDSVGPHRKMESFGWLDRYPFEVIMFHGQNVGKGETPMASPVIDRVPHVERQSVQMSMKVPPTLSSAQLFFRAVPMVGVGGLLAGSIYLQPNLVTGVAIIGAEVALGALAIAVWFPKHTK